MAQNDISAKNIFDDNAGLQYRVAPSATTIKAGEPVARALGGIVVTPAATNFPIVGTTYMAGIAITNSTNTASSTGIVTVVPVDVKQIWLANTSGTAFTQTTYNAQVGKRVYLTLTGSTYTISTTVGDTSTSGLVIAPLDVVANPGKVAFRVRAAASDLA